jgi:hypothetical protein
VTALVFGYQVEQVAQEAFQYGADAVLLADDPTLDDYRAEPYASVLGQLASASSPDIIFFPTTTRGRELAAMSAIDLRQRSVICWICKTVEYMPHDRLCWEADCQSCLPDQSTIGYPARTSFQQARPRSYPQRESHPGSASAI